MTSTDGYLKTPIFQNTFYLLYISETIRLTLKHLTVLLYTQKDIRVKEGKFGLDLKKLLASSCRQKILKELESSNEINVMALVSRTNSTYNEVNRNLKILEQEGIIINKRYRRLRLIKLNQKNSKTKLLIQVLKALDSESNLFKSY